MKIKYDPSSSKLLTFYDKVPSFVDGSDTPRAFLERCLETIEEREPHVKAFVNFCFDLAREAADASTARYKSGNPLGPLDGMPFAMKDVFETVKGYVFDGFLKETSFPEYIKKDYTPISTLKYGENNCRRYKSGVPFTGIAIVAIARPAPFTIHPTLPSNFT